MSQASYFFSTLFIAIFSPLGLCLTFAFLATLLPGKILSCSRRRGLFLLITLLFAAFCTPYVGTSLLRLMESLCPESVSADPSRPAVVLLLGGGSVTEGQSYQPSISSQRRMRQGIELLRHGQESWRKILLTGIEAPLMSRWLKSRYPSADVMQEKRSLNTESNLRLSAALLKDTWPDASQRPVVVVVTDRFHMARAMLWAKEWLHGFTVLPAPAPSLVRRGPCRPESFIPTCKGLELTSMAWRELLACIRDWVTLLD